MRRHDKPTVATQDEAMSAFQSGPSVITKISSTVEVDGERY